MKSEKFLFSASIGEIISPTPEMETAARNALNTTYPENVDNIKDPSFLYFKFSAVFEGRNNNGQIFLSEDLASTYKGFINQPIDKDHQFGIDAIVGMILDSEFIHSTASEASHIDCVGVIFKDIEPKIAYLVKVGHKAGFIKVSMECKASPDRTGEGTVLRNPKWVGIGLTRFPAEERVKVHNVSNDVASAAISISDVIETDGRILIPIIKINHSNIYSYMLNSEKYAGVYSVSGSRKDNKEYNRELIGFMFDKACGWNRVRADGWIEKFKNIDAQLLEVLLASEDFDLVIAEFGKLEKENIGDGLSLVNELCDNIDTGKKISYKERQSLEDEDFAYTKGSGENKVRKFPIQDEAHAKNALARLSQSDLTQEEKASVWDKIKRKWGSKIESMEDNKNPFRASINLEEDYEMDEKKIQEIVEKALKDFAGSQMKMEVSTLSTDNSVAVELAKAKKDAEDKEKEMDMEKDKNKKMEKEMENMKADYVKLADSFGKFKAEILMKKMEDAGIVNDKNKDEMLVKASKMNDEGMELLLASIASKPVTKKDKIDNRVPTGEKTDSGISLASLFIRN